MRNELALVKEGDALALYQHGVPRKVQAGRCTPTRVNVEGSSYLRTNGRKVGESNSYYSWYTRVRPWTEVQDKELVELRIERRLANSRDMLSAFAWRKVTQAQADYVLAAMASAGMLPHTASPTPTDKHAGEKAA